MPSSDGFDPNAPNRVLGDELEALGLRLVWPAEGGGWVVKTSIMDKRLDSFQRADYYVAPSGPRHVLIRPRQKKAE